MMKKSSSPKHKKPAQLFRKSSTDPYAKRFLYPGRNMTNSRGILSSVSPVSMKPLNFNSVNDDSAHPLSSLRSCSEYNKIRLDAEEEAIMINSEEPSFWVKWFSWKGKKTETAENFIESENRRRSRLCEDKIPVNPVCENVIPFTRAASIVPTPDRRNISGESTYSLLSLYGKNGGSQSGGYNSGTRISVTGSSRRRNSGDTVSFLDETTDMLDVVFGTGSTRGGSKAKLKQMEIELQDLSQIRRNRLNRGENVGLVPHRMLFSAGTDSDRSLRYSGQSYGSESERNSRDYSSDNGNSAVGAYDPDHEDAARQRAEVAFPRVLSWRSSSISEGDMSRTNSLVPTPTHAVGSRTNSFTGTLGSRTSSISGGLSRTNSFNSHNNRTAGSFSRSNSLTSNISNDSAASPAEDEVVGPSTVHDIRSLRAILTMMRAGTISFPTLVLLLIEKVRKVRHLLIDQHQDETFYEAVRIQPFSSGSYLRGMLIGGLCNMFFHLGMLLYWPRPNTNTGVVLTTSQQAVEWILYVWLIAIVLLHYVQLPIRLHIHLKCFASSRTVEVDDAVATLRSLFVSDYWLLNRALGWVTDLLSVVGIVAGELYLWFSYAASGGITNPLCGIITSITTTIVLAICIRVFIATLFCYSMHDPAVLAEARRRGLSKWDLEVLPTFVFSKIEDVNNPDGCSICLNTFTMGEMLISLPCDKRHSFHANCIRQWLHRQNSCPLCQKHV